MIRVLIAADNLVMRTGLEALLKSNSELEVVGSAASINSHNFLATRIQELQPDVVILEWHGEDDALAITITDRFSIESNHQQTGMPAFIVLTDSSVQDVILEALRVGVHAVLPRSATSDEIVAAIMAAAAGLVVLSGDVLEFLLSSAPTHNRQLSASPIQTLTGREIEVLDLLAEGQGNKAIAKRLGISEHTVKFHISSIFSKLNAQSRTEAVTLGARLGLIFL
jgi:two-component system, NarL family, response regulator YdfI